MLTVMRRRLVVTADWHAIELDPGRFGSMTKRLTETVRARLRMYLSDEVAAVAGLRLADLLLFIGGSKTLTNEQLERLASAPHP